jgi:hypothetical protein
MELITNNVDSRPIMFQIWIGLEKNPISGIMIFKINMNLQCFIIKDYTNGMMEQN